MNPFDLLVACMLDATIGDPRTLPHPVRWMGKLVAYTERSIRSFCDGPRALRIAGSVLAVGLPGLAFLLSWTLIAAGTTVHEWVGRGIGIWLASTALAWRDLIDHVGAVCDALKAGSLEDARHTVGLIVGRDTNNLSETEVVRATVETIAESASDGVIAPLLYLAVGGPPLALAYKAVSTLDSMIGHRDEQYRDFGWASARLDDIANWIPARITAALISVGAGVIFLNTRSMRRSGVILLRDGHKHPSPNSGRPEAAMAGALGVQLGGVNFYQGLRAERPVLGDAIEPLSIKHVDQAKRIMSVAYVMTIAVSMRLLWR